MGSFFRYAQDDGQFIRGAARILIAPMSVAFPTKIDDVIKLATGGTQYDAQSGWTDLGATKTGFQITINNAEETFTIDQEITDIRADPSSWECSAGTSLAEFTPERMQVAWEGSAITTDATPTTGSEKEIGFGAPTSYTLRRLAAVYKRPTSSDTNTSDKIRMYAFRKVQRSPQESSITHASTGEQISIPVRWRALPDSSVTDVTKRFFIVRDQYTSV
jgi:hypothetical protein